MTNGIRTGARSATVVALVAGSLLWLSTALPARAADGPQTPAAVLDPANVDSASSPFALEVDGGAFCDGTGGDNWRVHTFIVDDGVDLSTLNFNGSFPPGAIGSDYDATDGSISAPLFKGTNAGYNFIPAATPAGLIDPSLLSGFDFTLADWKLADGDYQIGFACTGPSSALRQWWSIPVTIDVDGSPFMKAGDPAPTAVATTLALTAAPADEATEGEEVTFTATVSPAAAAGTVTFEADGVVLGPAATVADGVATLKTSDLDVGTLEVTADFTPADATAYKASTATVDYTILSADAEETTLTLTVAPASTAPFGEPVTLTASVDPSDADGVVVFVRAEIDDVSATVELFDDVEVVDGKASVTTSELPVGEHELAAVFVPEDENAHQPSESLPVSYTITEAGATTSSSSSTTTTAAAGATTTTIASQVLNQSQSGPSSGRSALPVTGRGLLLVGLGALLVYVGRVAYLLARPRDIATRR